MPELAYRRDQAANQYGELPRASNSSDARHPIVLRISAIACGVSIVYALRIKDEPRRHDVRLSRGRP